METTRMDDMLGRYGECCSQVKAGHILGKSVRTIHRMMEDGRLRRVGTDVDIRSIAHYLENPPERNFAAKVRRKRPASRNQRDSFSIPGRRG